MRRIPENHQKLLEMLERLRIADLELLTGLCIAHRFSEHGVERAVENLTAAHYLNRIPVYRDPDWPSGRRRYAYYLGPQAMTLFAFDRAERARLERRMAKIESSEWRIYHDLFISRIYAALILLGRKRPDVFALERFDRGDQTTVMTPKGKKLIQPDARFSVLNPKANRRWNFFLEADTGTERQDSQDPTRYTITKKVRRYVLADAHDLPQKQFGIEGFHVLFLTPKRYVPGELRPRERNMMATVAKSGGENWEMFRFLSLSDLDFHQPERLLDAVLYDASGRKFPLIGGTQ